MTDDAGLISSMQYLVHSCNNKSIKLCMYQIHVHCKCKFEVCTLLKNCVSSSYIMKYGIFHKNNGSDSLTHCVGSKKNNIVLLL